MTDRAEVKILFSRAAELPADRRKRFLEKACRGDRLLLREVESLLASHEDADAFLGRLADSVLPETIRNLSPDILTDACDARIGTHMGQYEILERLGRGGMGVVYKARHDTLDQFAALKFLPEHLSRDAAAKERFIFEARAAFALEHINICTIYDIGESSDGQLYIVMAYYQGHTLKHHILEGSLGVERATDFASQIAEGLGRAHAAGIVHRDIKPANLLITDDETVKILDFGVAKSQHGAPLTQSGATLGTVAYMSPEQATGGHIDHRTDFWSLGVVWYEMLAGERPFQAEYEQAVVYNIVNVDPEPISACVPDVPEAIERILMRCLAKSLDDRYQNSADLFANIYRARRISSAGPQPRVAGLSPDPERAPSGSGGGAGQPGAHVESTVVARKRLFISYKRDAEEDATLVQAIAHELSGAHDVFLDTNMSVGVRWVERIETEISRADYFIVLLSSTSVKSEMVLGEIELATRLARERGDRPIILPIRVRYSKPFTYPLDSHLGQINWTTWEAEADTPRILAELSRAVSGGGFLTTAPAEAIGRDDDTGPIHEPYMSAQPRLLESPEGTIDTESNFYVQRREDGHAYAAIARAGVTLTIKGPRQMGKSSLLLRTMMEARKHGKEFVFLDFQLFDSAALENADLFFMQFCSWITDELDLEDRVEASWERPLGNSQKCTRYIRRHILKAAERPIVLAMDEVERVFDTPFRSDFFSMLRSWHNDRAIDPLWRKLDLALVTSTEPYQLIENLNQSPFNVGEIISLTDFTSDEVAELNKRMGSPLSEQDVVQLMGLVDGHPYLVRKALYIVASNLASAKELFATATEESSPFGDHLRYHYFRLHKNAELVQAMKCVVNGDGLIDEKLYWRLRGAGLVKRVGSRVQPRCRLYTDYLRSRIVA